MPGLALGYRLGGPVEPVHEIPVAFPWVVALQHVDVGIAEDLGEAASAEGEGRAEGGRRAEGEGHVGDESSEAVSPADPVEDDHILGIGQGAAVPLPNGYWDYTWKGWAYMRSHFGEQGEEAGFRVDADPDWS